MTVFEKVKAAVTARQAAEMYGMNVRNNGMTNCPFHEDHNPSMKLDQNFYCFGCHAHGDVIDFTARLFGISRYSAAVKLAEDFGISEPPPTHPNIGKTNAEPFRPSVTFCIFLLRDYLHLLWLWRIRYEPTAAEKSPMTISLKLVRISLSFRTYWTSFGIRMPPFKNWHMTFYWKMRIGKSCKTT